MKKHPRLFLLFTLITLIVTLSCGLCLYWYFRTIHYHSDQTRKEDIDALTTGEYDCLLLSMYPTESFNPEDFSYYRALTTLKANHCFETISDISDYLQAALDAEQAPTNIYIGLDASAISEQYYFHTSLYYREYQKKLLPIISGNPQITFEILLPYYSMDYWNRLSAKKQEEYIASYRNFVNIFSEQSNVIIYFMGYEEWLICNPANYEAFNSCNLDVTSFLLAITFRDDYYELTLDNMEQHFTTLTSLITNSSNQANAPENNHTNLSYPNLSNYDIVFFGDSVIGNYTSSLSIPGVTQGLSGAHTFNIAQGGTCATMNADPSVASLNTIVDAFLAMDNQALDPTQQPYMGMQVYLEYISSKSANSDTQTCFVINYGLNDYFSGQAIESEDPFDIYTYKGSIRTAVNKLQKAYPDSMIFLMTPNFCSYFGNGTQLQSEKGGQLTDYVYAVLEISDELDVYCIDNYNNLEINANNHAEYLSDGCHPNELGRYRIGQHILQAMKDQ